MRKLLIASLLLVAGIATAADDSVARLNKLYADFWEENLKVNPFTGTFAGDPRYNAQLPNFFSEEYEAELRAFHQKYLDAAKKLGAVTGPLTNSAGLNSAYSRLGIPPDKAAQFTPTILDAVGKAGGDSVRNLLATALK